MGKTHEETTRAKADAARGMLSDYANRAVQILQELAEYGDNDRIRLSAANSILDRAGVQAPQQIELSAAPEEHQLARDEAVEIMQRIKENAQPASLPKPPLSIEAVVVHEGDVEEVSASSS
jgi:hypothetical protein